MATGETAGDVMQATEDELETLDVMTTIPRPIIEHQLRESNPRMVATLAFIRRVAALEATVNEHRLRMDAHRRCNDSELKPVEKVAEAVKTLVARADGFDRTLADELERIDNLCMQDDGRIARLVALEDNAHTPDDPVAVARLQVRLATLEIQSRANAIALGLMEASEAQVERPICPGMEGNCPEGTIEDCESACASGGPKKCWETAFAAIDAGTAKMKAEEEKSRALDEADSRAMAPDLDSRRCGNCGLYQMAFAQPPADETETEAAVRRAVRAVAEVGIPVATPGSTSPEPRCAVEGCDNTVLRLETPATHTEAIWLCEEHCGLQWDCVVEPAQPPMPTQQVLGIAGRAMMRVPIVPLSAKTAWQCVADWLRASAPHDVPCARYGECHWYHDFGMRDGEYAALKDERDGLLDSNSRQEAVMANQMEWVKGLRAAAERHVARIIELEKAITGARADRDLARQQRDAAQEVNVALQARIVELEAERDPYMSVGELQRRITDGLALTAAALQSSNTDLQARIEELEEIERNLQTSVAEIEHQCDRNGELLEDAEHRADSMQASFEELEVERNHMKTHYVNQNNALQARIAELEADLGQLRQLAIGEQRRCSKNHCDMYMGKTAREWFDHIVELEAAAPETTEFDGAKWLRDLADMMNTGSGGESQYVDVARDLASYIEGEEWHIIPLPVASDPRGLDAAFAKAEQHGGLVVSCVYSGKPRARISNYEPHYADTPQAAAWAAIEAFEKTGGNHAD